MADPDAPSRADPKFREVCHWTVINIPGSDLAKGNTLFEYLGSGPPEGTGLHRYTFLLFKQPDGKLNFDEEFVPRTYVEIFIFIINRFYHIYFIL